uniref:Uncharacterized protein n=1 Tax=Panagrolaimus sp. ES5 TaxID=591445 RepID=A0AC34FPZ9_9BILA
MKGLTTYAYNNRLKRPPLFLKGGFKMWSFTYAPYTNKEFNNSLFSEDDEFGRLLQEMKQSVEVSYPDLISRQREPEPPWPTSTVPPRRPETSFSTAPDAPPVSRPQFDRSQKPTAPPRTLPPNIPPAPTYPAVSLKSVPKALPAVGTLGGARVADPTPPQLPSSKQS